MVTYFYVSVDNVEGVAIFDRIDNWSDSVCSLFLTKVLFFQNCVKQLSTIDYEKVYLSASHQLHD
jgi:hypothetical protein